MPKLKDTVGSGMTERGILRFDWNEPFDVEALIQAAATTAGRSSFAWLVQRLTDLATRILVAAKLPSDPGMMYRVTADGTCEPAGAMEPDAELDADRLPLQMAVATCGYAPDSPEGYAANVLMLLRSAQEQLRAGSMDEAMASAFAAGELVNEAAMKGMFEPDFLAGEKVREGGREGHKRAYGTEEQRAVRRSSYLKAFDLLRANKVDTMEAYRLVANHFGVSARTIRRTVEQTKRLA